MKIRSVILSLLFICSAHILSAKEIPARPYPPRLVNDLAGILAGNEAAALERKLVAYNDSTSIQIAVVIEPSLEGDDIFDYTVRLAKGWGIGQKDTDNGILVYVAAADRKIYIQSGYGTEGFLTDALSKRIIENIIKPSFREQQYFQGLDRATDAIMQLGSGEYQAGSNKSSKKLPFFLIVLMVVGVIILLSALFGGGSDDDGGYYRGGRYDDADGKGGRRRGGGWIFFPGAWGWGTGGDWGGSDSGGFGDFGGFGGGDFGGGGAGGDW